MSKRPLHSTVTWQFSADNSELDPSTTRETTAQPQYSGSRRASAGNVLGSSQNALLLSEKRRRLMLLAHFHNKNVSSSDHSSEDLGEIAKNDGENSKQSSPSNVQTDNEENRPIQMFSSSNNFADRQKLDENVNVTAIDDHKEPEVLSAREIKPIDCQPSTSATTYLNSDDFTKANLQHGDEELLKEAPKESKFIGEPMDEESNFFLAANITTRTKSKRPLIDEKEERNVENISSESPHFEFAPPAKKRHFPSTTTIKLASSSLPLLLFSFCPISASTSSSHLSSSKYSFSSNKTKSLSASSLVHFSSSSYISSSMPKDSLKHSSSHPGEMSLNSEPISNQHAPSTSSFLPMENSLPDSSISSSFQSSQSLDSSSSLLPTVVSSSSVSVSSVSNVFVRHRAASTASLLNSSHSWKIDSFKRVFKSATFDESMKSNIPNSHMNRGEALKARKLPKKKVNFSGLRVFYFRRTQGFDTVPMTGSVALGMENQHHNSEDYSFFEFNKRNRRENAIKFASWRRAADSEIRSRSTSRAVTSPKPAASVTSLVSFATENTSPMELNNNLCASAGKLPLLNEKTSDNVTVDSSALITSSSRDDSALDFLSSADDATTVNEIVHQTVSENIDENSAETIEANTAHGDKLLEQCSSSSDFSADEDIDDEFAQLECQFQPIRNRIRKTILKTSGICIDLSNRDEYKKIVQSRSACGCDCVGGVCEADTCACAKIGVGCQVDRQSFPCGCASDLQCKNPEGRIEFDPLKVHTHFLQTIMRLKVIQKRGLENSLLSVSPQHIKFGDENEMKTETSSPKNIPENSWKNASDDQPKTSQKSDAGDGITDI